jgi:hypothetical protein
MPEGPLDREIAEMETTKTQGKGVGRDGIKRLSNLLKFEKNHIFTLMKIVTYCIRSTVKGAPTVLLLTGAHS